jgi:Ca2+-binding EF-hand superfamily protein
MEIDMTYGSARVLLFVGALALAAPVQAQSQQETFKRIDTNHDGFVVRAEHDAEMRRKFDGTDTNRDGVIVAGEEAAWIVETTDVEVLDPTVLLVAQKAGIEQWDRSGDNKVSWAEYKGYTDAIRDGMDVNKDGKLTLHEVTNARYHIKVR